MLGEMYVVGCEHMANQVLMFMYTTTCASSFRECVGVLSHMYEY